MVYGLGDTTGGGVALIATAIPCVPFLIGVVEFIFGVPIRQTSDKWDALQGWQRGVLGSFIALLFFVVAAGLFIVAGYTGLI